MRLKEPYYSRVLAWCEALESGKYEQGKQRLKDANNCYCCLGIACELSNLGEWEALGTCYKTRYERSDAVLPAEVRDYYGLISKCGKDKESSLVRLNDLLKFDFFKIAIKIREGVEDIEIGLFQPDLFE